ncbi:MAG: hypothetical protein KAT75_07130, partial [Dehalococcoidia bacterium]|nr:hypothetical protein [Dehalococcoidia bacterium]
SERKLFVHSVSWQKLFVLDTQTMNVVHTVDDIGAVGIALSEYGPSLIIWDCGSTVRFVNTETYEVTEFTDDSIGFLQIQESKSAQGQWYVVTQRPEGWIVGLYDYEEKVWNASVSIPPQDEGESIQDLKVLTNERKAYAAVWGGFYLDYHGYGWLYCIDLVEWTVEVVPIDGGAQSLETSPDSQWVYVGTNHPKPTNVNNILVVDTQSDTIVGSIDLSKLARLHLMEVRDLQIDPVSPHFLYATSNDANAFVKADLDSLTLADVLVFNEASFQPHFFVKQPGQGTGYILIHQSAYAFELDLDNAAIEKLVRFPMIRTDAYAYDVAINDAGRLFIAQGETILEVDVEDMSLIETHALSPDINGLWSFVLSNDQTKLYSIWPGPTSGGGPPDTFLAISTSDFQVEANFRLEGG